MQIEELKKIAEAATPGPWEFRIDPMSDSENPQTTYALSAPYKDPVSGGECRTDILRSYGRGYWNGFSELTDKDFEFIATFSPSTVLALLDRLEIAIDELKRQWACEPHRNGDECGHADTAKKALTALREPLK